MASEKQRVDVKNSEVVKRSDYTRILNAIIAGGFCPFCEEHLFKHHRQPVIYKNKYWLVTKNSWPYKGSKFHFIFITRSHIEKTEDMSPMVWKELQNIYKKVIKESKINGATLMIRSGDTRYTGASVNHLHAHLIVGVSRMKNTKAIKALVGFKK
jgi:diadenosine tetraphosphate (Ap4A) HIT family hydrolase